MMEKIDISKWGKYKVEDLFETVGPAGRKRVPTGGMIKKTDLVNGDIPRITVSGENNGVLGYFGNIDSSNYRIYENFISVSFLGTVFYHPGKASLDMKVHCLKPLNIALDLMTAQFLVTVLRKKISNFEYNDQLSSTVLPNLEIELPTTPNGKPDWIYMKNYMLSIVEQSKISLSNLRQAGI